MGFLGLQVSKEPSAPTDAEPDAASDCDACVFTFDVGEEAAAAAATATAAGADDAALVNETPSRNSSKVVLYRPLTPKRFSFRIYALNSKTARSSLFTPRSIKM